MLVFAGLGGGLLFWPAAFFGPAPRLVFASGFLCLLRPNVVLLPPTGASLRALILIPGLILYACQRNVKGGGGAPGGRGIIKRAEAQPPPFIGENIRAHTRNPGTPILPAPLLLSYRAPMAGNIARHFCWRMVR